MKNLSELKIIFFDVGNILVSDDPSGCYIYRRLYERITAEGTEISERDFFANRVAHLLGGGSLWSYVAQYIPEQEFKDWQIEVRRHMYESWGRYSPAFPSMQNVPARLAERYRLGLLANQPAQVEDLLAERGQLHFFDVRGISDKVGLKKPDPAFFQWGLEQAGVQPHEALMIGDRIDNDIRPAKALGMRTLWLCLGKERQVMIPQDEFEKEYLNSIRKVCWSDAAPERPEDEPDAKATSAAELLELLDVKG